MPIARFEMPDGRIARFEVPEGTTPEQAMRLIEPVAASMYKAPVEQGENQSAKSQEEKKLEDSRNLVKKAQGNGLVGGLLEGVFNLASGTAANAAGNVAGLAMIPVDYLSKKLGYEGSIDTNPTNVKNTIEKTLTYEPQTESGKAIAEYNPLALLSKGGAYLGDKIGDVIAGGDHNQVDATSARGVAANAAAEGVKQGFNFLPIHAIAKSFKGKSPVDERAQAQSIIDPAVNYDVPTYIRRNAELEAAKKAAEEVSEPQLAKPTVIEPTDVKAPLPEALQSIVDQSGGKANMTAAERHAEAQSLPVPVELTAGQATGDIHILSREQNLRSKYQELGDRFNDQNLKLIQNAAEIKSKAAPDINPSDTMIDHSQSLIDAYKEMDMQKRAAIREKYQALQDANGGELPIDGKAFVEKADAALKNANVSRFIPPEIRGILEDERSAGGMNFNTFENYRTILADQARAAERAGNGTAGKAVSIVRDALENTPLNTDVAGIKQLADMARQAASERFTQIRNDPAYKAVTRDKTPIGEPSPLADSFAKNYVIKGKTANVQKMVENLGDNPIVQQRIAAAVIDHLRDVSGIDLRTDTGNFSQARYNAALEKMIQDNKLNRVLPNDAAQQVKTLGNVAKYTQDQPRGSYVNNSNTFVASAMNKATTAAEGVANQAAYGVPVGTWTKEAFARRAKAKELEYSLQHNAGILPKGKTPLDPQSKGRGKLQKEMDLMRQIMQQRAANAVNAENVKTSKIRAPFVPIVTASEGQNHNRVSAQANLAAIAASITSASTIDEAIRQAKLATE